MNIIRATLDKLAGVLACREDQAEDVLRSAASARASFSRRGLFKAAGGVAAGCVLFEPPPLLVTGARHAFVATADIIVEVPVPPASWASLSSLLREAYAGKTTAELLLPGAGKNRVWALEGARRTPEQTPWLFNVLGEMAREEGTELVML